MKTATLTFHWANNYGAVLQAYALQRFLVSNGLDTEIIDYRPFNLYFKELIRDILRNDKRKRLKRKNIGHFVKKEIRLSKETYYFYASLPQSKYDCLICGSDQIWNEWFLNHEQHNKPCLSYYLGFASEKCKRISYAASFGTDKLTEKSSAAIEAELSKFTGISVRENTAIDILRGLNLKGYRVCDPTLLLKDNDYLKLIQPISTRNVGIFSYILHGKEFEARAYSNAVNELAFTGCAKITDSFFGGIYEWLATIRDSDYVVTNSFHGTVFCLLFHKDFIVLPVDGKNMNDRIVTLLEDVDLQSRFCYSKESIDSIVHDTINWEMVDKAVEVLSKKSADWLLSKILS